MALLQPEPPFYHSILDVSHELSQHELYAFQMRQEVLRHHGIARNSDTVRRTLHGLWVHALVLPSFREHSGSAGASAKLSFSGVVVSPPRVWESLMRLQVPTVSLEHEG